MIVRNLVSSNYQRIRQKRAIIIYLGRMMNKYVIRSSFGSSTFEIKELIRKFFKKRRLVELLAIYPDEEIQSHRFKKISEALGTRTPKQVNYYLRKNHFFFF